MNGLEALSELHTTMTSRIVRLEAIADDMGPSGVRSLVVGYVRGACALRDLLTRLCMSFSLEEDAVGDSIRWAYLTSIEQIEALLCALGGEAPPDVWPGERVASALLAIDEVLAQLTKKRDWIQRACGAL